MAASSITCCASWHRRMRLAAALLSVFALAGCGVAYSGEPPAGAEEGQVREFSTDGIELGEEAQVVDLSTDELSALLEKGNIRLIDVRRDDEVAEGMIPGAEHIMLDNFDPAALDLTDGREVVLYCRSGRRSGIAAEKLAAHTGKPAKHLGGGILAWQEAGLELETASAD